MNSSEQSRPLMGHFSYCSGHTGAMPLAAFHLGGLLKEQGDVKGAKTAYQQATYSTNTYVVAKAHVSTAELLEEQGDVGGAKAAYQRAIDSGDTGCAPLAQLFLGGMLRELGDLEGVEGAYQQAIDSGHTRTHAARLAEDHLELLMAERQLLLILNELGDVEDVKTANGRPIDST
jgi:tetratricopeptide (TPR) repeat protein